MASETLIVTKNESLRAWLEERGIKGPCLEMATPSQVAHRHIYGVVPYWLAAFAETVSQVAMPGLDPADRARFNQGELTVQEMDAAGAVLESYQVRKV
jgi:hypothetical protein